MQNSLLAIWHKENSKKIRRQVILKHCHNNKLVAAQILLGIHNKGRDPEVRKKARADAVYFLNLSKHNGHRR